MSAEAFLDTEMTLDELKAEVRAASPEVREELFTLLGVLRRARNPERARMLAGKLDDPSLWISEEDTAQRLGLDISGPMRIDGFLLDSE